MARAPFLVEPNIKEGRGGLRDLQTLYWMTRYVFGTQVMGELVGPESPLAAASSPTLEAKHARRSWDFLWTVRFHLHYVAGRAEDRLTFDLQPVVGARMGYTRHGRQDGVERFMRHYFLTAREITRITTVLEPAIVRAALGPPALEAENAHDPALLAARPGARGWPAALCGPRPRLRAGAVADAADPAGRAGARAFEAAPARPPRADPARACQASSCCATTQRPPVPCSMNLLGGPDDGEPGRAEQRQVDRPS